MRKKIKRRIEAINKTISQYGAMTIRQIYYRLLPKGGNYRQIMYACKIGRKEGLISYSDIVDRSRPIYGTKLFRGYYHFINEISDYFSLDYWINSSCVPEIWTEKDALSQILYEESQKYHVKVFVTKGFLSISNKVRWGGSNKAILYFGDFDPSGLYIDKDIKFEVSFKDLSRIALTQKHIQENKLPSVQVNKKDPRARSYIAEYGNKGWELDALNPNLLRQLVRDSIEEYIDFDLEQKREEESEIRDRIENLTEEE